MKYRILLHPNAHSSLKKTDSTIRSSIVKKVKDLEFDPSKGKSLKHSNFKRIRVGDYRVIYEINEMNKSVIILFIGHRKNVYDDFSRLL